MLDIKFVRQNADAVKENIIKKFQHEKLHLVDEVIKLDEEVRAAKTRGDELRSARNTISREIGSFMKQGLKDKAEEAKKKVAEMAAELEALEKKEVEMGEELKKRMMVIPQMIGPEVPIGKDDSENVEIEKFGEPVVPDWEIPYHVD
ncbi:MAG: serine--tRNA ligase, partial [Firmicutes bacterium]|nr:serine--tRNA ligase [Bacillota bacterium]